MLLARRRWGSEVITSLAITLYPNTPLLCTHGISLNNKEYIVVMSIYIPLYIAVYITVYFESVDGQVIA